MTPFLSRRRVAAPDRWCPSAALVLIAALLFPVGGHAAFQYDAGPDAGVSAAPVPTTSAGTLPPQSVSVTTSPVSAAPLLPPPPAGTPVRPQLQIRASGHDMPLPAALHILVPRASGYSIAPLATEVAGRRVTFHGIARSWDVVLPEALASAGLVASVSGKVITIAVLPTAARAPSPAPQAAMPPRPEGAALSAAPLPPVPAPSGPPSDPHAAVEAAPLPQTWEVKEGSTLKSTLADWAARMGWKVNWKARDDDGNEIVWPVDEGGGCTLVGNWLPVGENDHSVVEDLLAGFDSAPRHPHVTMSRKYQQLEVTVE